MGPHPQAGREPRLGASSISSTQTSPTVELEACSQALGAAHFTPEQPLPDPVRRLWGRCSLPATSWESLGKTVHALLKKQNKNPKTLYTHKLHEKWSMPVETMPIRKNQSLHCRLVSSLRSLSQAHKDSISFVPNIQKTGKVPILMATLKNRVTLEIT